MGDDDLLVVYPEPKSWKPFLIKAAKAQQKNGGDRYIGRKLVGMFDDAGLVDIKANVTTLTSKEIGMNTFLDITTRFKKNRLKGILPDSVINENLRDIYSSLLSDSTSFASVGLFVAIGIKPP